MDPQPENTNREPTHETITDAPELTFDLESQSLSKPVNSPLRKEPDRKTNHQEFTASTDDIRSKVVSTLHLQATIHSVVASTGTTALLSAMEVNDGLLAIGATAANMLVFSTSFLGRLAIYDNNEFRNEDGQISIGKTLGKLGEYASFLGIQEPIVGLTRVPVHYFFLRIGLYGLPASILADAIAAFGVVPLAPHLSKLVRSSVNNLGKIFKK